MTIDTLRGAAVAIGLLAMIGAADPPRPVFGAGALRRDGVIIPFAAFDGKKWVATWPTPTRQDLTVPINLRSVPKHWWGPTKALETWQLSTAAGARAATVVQPDWVNVHCVRQIGLRTDYRMATPPPPPTEQPYPKDGLAVSPPQAVERIAVLEPAGFEARSLQRVLLDAFNRAEREVEDRFGHPIGRRAREGVDPMIEAVYALGTAPRVYYVESLRSYRRLGQRADECTGVAFGTGWFVRDGETVRPLEMAVDLLPCNRYGASYMLPLGALRIGDRLFWLAQFSGWDHERFAVIEIKSKGPKPVESVVAVVAVVNVWGGGC
ncbi:MAG: hypothetical protein HY048_20470 [Acidobacteria bacterium]|nr:hypothetical protein [Acidobacteriota bacterium]